MPLQPLQEAAKDSPYRCDGKGSGPTIQCPFLSMEGLVLEGSNPYDHDETLVQGIKKCPRHGGKVQVDRARKKQLNRYRVQSLESDILRQMEGPAKDLYNELAVVRMLLERLLNVLGTQLNGPAMFAYVGQIERFIARTESLVSTIQRVESKSDQIMGPNEMVAYANRIVKIITEYVPEDKQEEVALKIQHYQP